jgi:predicted transposase/invertase (TIGR01784 family)
LYFKDLELHTIELKKFSGNENEDLTDIIKKVKNSLDIWMAFLTRHDLLDRSSLPKELNDSELKKALTVLEVMNFSEEEREAYEGHLKWLRIEANTLKKYENKGRIEGREEGRIEEKLEIAKSMLQDAEPIEKIMRWTSLSKEDLAKLKQS